MPDVYHPPFTITEEITNLVIEIAEYVGAIVAREKTNRAGRWTCPAGFIHFALV